jgi:hypothetical protein
LTYDHFDRVAALGLVGAVGLRAVAVGEVAGALHGWPLILSEEGTLDLVVHPEDREIAEESVLAAAASRGRVRLLDVEPEDVVHPSRVVCTNDWASWCLL